MTRPWRKFGRQGAGRQDRGAAVRRVGSRPWREGRESPGRQQQEQPVPVASPSAFINGKSIGNGQVGLENGSWLRGQLDFVSEAPWLASLLFVLAVKRGAGEAGVPGGRWRKGVPSS